MSTFLIIKKNRVNQSDTSRACSFYKKLNPKQAGIEPKIFLASWGALIYWEGLGERLANWRTDNHGEVQLNLGWNAHTELEPGLKKIVFFPTSESSDLTPLLLPQHSVGIYSIIKATTDFCACIPDPFSSYPIYYLIQEGETSISNDPILTMAMAGQIPQPSELGIIERLLTEANLGENYIFKNIPRLKPGQWIAVSETGTKVNSYQFEIKKVEQAELETYMLAQFKKLAHLNRPVILKLTGGRDTRLNLALALKAGVRPLCYTIKSVDSKVADSLSKSYGLLHVHVDLNGNPIDATSPASREYETIRSTAVFISGANGSISRAHYLKEETGDISDEKKTVTKTYLGYKRIALLSRKNFKNYFQFFLKWWEAMNLTENNWWFKGHHYDAIYIERCRTFGGEAWARSSGAIDVPTLSGPLMYAYGLCFTPAQRTQDLSHEKIINSYIGEQKIEYLGHHPSFLGKLFELLPVFIKTFTFRLVYKYRYNQLPQNKKLSEETFNEFADIFSKDELKTLYLTRKQYVDETANLLKKARLIKFV